MILADRRGRPPRRARQAASRPARRLRRDLPDHGGPARHHPPARSAAARIPAAQRGGVRRGRARLRPRRRDAAPPRRRACRIAIRCSAIAAAGSASPVPKSTRCRRAPSSRPRSTWPGKGRRRSPRSWCRSSRRAPSSRSSRALIDRTAGAVFEETGRRDRLSGRNDDRAAPRRAARRRYRRPRPNSSASAPTISPRPLSGSAATMPARFLAAYVEQGIFARDPFVSLDVEGVGELIALAAERGRAAQARPQARHLRRAWRRSGQHRLLRERRPRLRLRLALPRADRPARRGAGGAAGRRA